MRTIHKYQLPLYGGVRNVIAMPKGATIVKAAIQQGIPTVWATVDTDMHLTKRCFEFVGTGHTTPDLSRSAYVDSFIFADGGLVLHLFEVLP